MLQKLPPDVAKQVLALVPCSLLELLSGLPPPLHGLALLSKIACRNTVVTHSLRNPRGPPLSRQSAIPSLVPHLLLNQPLLSSFVLDNWDISMPSIQSLAAALPHFSHLTRLSLSHSLTTPGHIATLSPYLPYIPVLRDLNVASAAIDSVAATTFAQHLARTTRLTALDVSENPIFPHGDPSAAHAFVLAVATLPSLATLNIASTGLPCSTAVLMLRHLAGNACIRRLNLACCIDHSETLEGELQTSLLALTELQSLRMSWALAPTAFPPVASLPVALSRLHLCDHAGQVDALKFSACLAHLTALRVLDVSGNDWEVASLVQIRGALANLPFLHTLSLLSPHPEVPMLSMLDTIPGLTTLRSLGICGWAQDADVEEQVQATLAEVTHLSISYGAHARFTSAHIGSQLGGMARLRSLCLQGHDVCRNMLPAVAPLTALTRLVLVDTRTGPTTIRSREIWMQLRPLVGLEVLDVALNAGQDAHACGSWDVELLTHFVLLHKYWPALRELHMELQNVAKHDLVDGMYIHDVCIRKHVHRATLDEFM